MEPTPVRGPARAEDVNPVPEPSPGVGAPGDVSVGPRRILGEPLVRLAAIIAIFVALAAAIVVPTAVRVKGISPFDEAPHADYAYQIAHGHIPARGSIIAPAIRADIVCHGSAQHPGATSIGCGTVPPARDLGAHGEDYTFVHPPVYYLITGVLARVILAVTPITSFITAARLVGVLWLAAAMVVLYLGLRRFRIPWPFAFFGAAPLAFAPAIYYQEATVTNDAAAALCGAAAVWLIARLFVEGRRGWVLPAVLAVLAASTKTLNAMPFLALAGVLLILGLRGWRADRARARELLLVALAMVVGVFIVYEGWTIIQNHRGLAHWTNPILGFSGRPVHGLPFDELLSTSFSGTAQLSASYLPYPLRSSTGLIMLLRLWGPLSIAAVGAVVMSRERAARTELGATTILGVLAVPLVVEIQVYISSKLYFPDLIPRYGISFIPLLLAAVAIVAADHGLKKSLAGFAVAAFAVGLFTVL